MKRVLKMLPEVFKRQKRYIATQEAGCTYASELQLAFVCFDLYPRHIAPALMLQRTPPQADQDRKDEPVFGAGILSRLRCKTAFLSRQKHDVKSGAFPLCQLQIGTGNCTRSLFRNGRKRIYRLHLMNIVTNVLN